jgi:hypothetical protein
MNCDHIHNKKIRLILSEFDANGYWIWACLVADAYRTNGYYFDTNDKDALELFALDVCKKQVSLVREVIQGCVRRGLFDKTVFDAFGILTSEHMQDTYIKATKERRKKGTTVTLRQDYLLVQITADDVNIAIIPRTNPKPPGTKGKNPGTNPQSKVEYSKEASIAGAEAPAAPVKTFKQWTEKEFGNEIAKYSEQHPKDRLRAFFNHWKEKNASGTKMKFQLERTWETKNRLETWARNEAIFGGNKTTSTNNQTNPNEYIEQRLKDQQKLESQLGH